MKVLIATFLIAISSWATSYGQDYQLTSNENLEKMIPADLPSGIDFKGLFKNGVSYKDKTGTNFFFVTELWNTRHTKNKLYFYLVTLKQKVAKVQWELMDEGTKDCEVQFLENSLRVIDLDGDGYMENSFIYQFDCESNRARELRLIFNSRGDRLAMWGKLEKGYRETKVNTTDNYRSAPHIYRWFMQKDWEDVTLDGSIDYDRTWYAFLPEGRIMKNRNLATSTGSTYEWVDEKGKPIYLSDELYDIVTTAHDFKLMPNGEDLLVLHAQALGVLNLRSRKFSTWVDFYDYTFILNSWVWTHDSTRFAFPAFNSVKYEKDSQIFVIDMDSSGMVKKRKYDIALDYTLGDILTGPPLEWDADDMLYYIPRRNEGQQFQPEHKILLITEEE